MEHLKNREILDHLAAGGEGDAECSAHLESCSSCRRRFENFRKTWQLLGCWNLPEGSQEFIPRCLHAAGNEQEPQSGTKGRWILSWRWAQTAAVAVAMLTGFVAGRHSRLPENPGLRPAAGSDFDAQRAMRLDLLGGEPTGLAHRLLAAGIQMKEEP